MRARNGVGALTLDGVGSAHAMRDTTPRDYRVSLDRRSYVTHEWMMITGHGDAPRDRGHRPRVQARCAPGDERVRGGPRGWRRSRPAGSVGAGDAGGNRGGAA